MEVQKVEDKLKQLILGNGGSNSGPLLRGLLEEAKEGHLGRRQVSSSSDQLLSPSCLFQVRRDRDGPVPTEPQVQRALRHLQLGVLPRQVPSLQASSPNTLGQAQAAASRPGLHDRGESGL